jgi:hypothetical protein
VILILEALILLKENKDGDLKGTILGKRAQQHQHRDFGASPLGALPGEEDSVAAVAHQRLAASRARRAVETTTMKSAR